MNIIRRRNQNKAFTLVELLVVILIIAVLAGLLFGAIGGAIRAAKRLRAQKTVTELAAALRHYYTEYGHWPTGANGSAQQVDANMVLMLTGDVSAAANNPKRIVFMEIGGKDVVSGVLTTPWYNSPGVANANRYYYYCVDVNADNSLTFNPGTGNLTLKTIVATWTTEPSPNRLVASW